MKNRTKSKLRPLPPSLSRFGRSPRKVSRFVFLNPVLSYPKKPINEYPLVSVNKITRKVIFAFVDVSIKNDFG